MYVRGGNNDENLYLLEGNPLYQVNHAAGLFSGFNVEAIESTDFYKSAFPARYGGRLSSVVDIRTKDGNLREHHGNIMLGLTSGSFNLELNECDHPANPMTFPQRNRLISSSLSFSSVLLLPPLR